MSCLCDWCGRPAVTRTYRTLYSDTEFAQTSSYFECAECSQIPNAEIAGMYTTLCTFPDDDKDYCKVFIVKTEWLYDWWRENHDGELPVDAFYEWLQEYAWDSTWFAYLSAKAEKVVVTEYEQK